jgi:hypothetical protein
VKGSTPVSASLLGPPAAESPHSQFVGGLGSFVRSIFLLQSARARLATKLIHDRSLERLFAEDLSFAEINQLLS